MSQVFNNDSQQKQQNDVDSFCAVQMAQIAQMMLSAQMTAAAQMASLNSENGRNGLLDLLGIKNEEETIINKEVDDNQELNKCVSPYEEPRAKKPKTERKSSEKPGNNEIKKNSQINDNSDQKGSFNQNNNYGDFASVLRALTCSSTNFAGAEQSTTTNLLDTSSSDPLSSQFPSNQITSTDDPTAFLMATMAAAATQNVGINLPQHSKNVPEQELVMIMLRFYASIESVAADLLASIGRQQMQNNSLGDEGGGNNCGIEFCKGFFKLIPGGSSSGRRANRTRFTDFQLRTMQDFFDKQAYPKDDDLEMLSKKLGLSPRVIVVWFQNARQKARKVFEQQPHLMAHPSIIEQMTTEGRFTRTPSSANFQCKVCGQVFQRYLELIQHQQRICCSVKLEEQQNNEGGDFNVSEILNGKITKNENLEENGIEEEENKHLFLQQQSSNIESSSQEMILFNQLLAAAGCSQQQINQVKFLFKKIIFIWTLMVISAALLLPSLFGGQKRIINDGINQRQRPQSQSNNSKRFRTHLTPMQVKSEILLNFDDFRKFRYRKREDVLIKVMKSLFHDYKTPSMQECDSLGRRIGLTKRVVQVWFQNTRAKERKAGSSSGSAEPEELIPCCEDVLNNQSSSSSLSPQQQIGQSLTAVAQLPYYALAAAAAGGIGGMPMNGLLPPLLYDPLLFGTPVSALKVPESVSQQIITDMSSGKGQSCFTQDGLEINKLESKLADNFGFLSSVDLEVGWGCQNCNNVFQQPELLQNHWKLICPAGEDIGAFKLIQTHYQCNPCQKKFGTQDDFCDHCLSMEHKTNCRAKKENK
uniref:Uncharacterized protein n=1 Tax=Meloidogyne javanica TaxID=6303 RepID=A0A915MUF6_MELJA